jgi:hypothetical protein
MDGHAYLVPSRPFSCPEIVNRVVSFLCVYYIVPAIGSKLMNGGFSGMVMAVAADWFIGVLH